MTFVQLISPEMNVIAELDFEPPNFEAAVQYWTDHGTKTTH